MSSASRRSRSISVGAAPARAGVVEDLDPGAAALLRGVHRDVRVAEHRLGVGEPASRRRRRPTLAVMTTSRPDDTGIGSAMTSAISFAAPPGGSMSVRSGHITTNSSPERRATVSTERVVRCRRRAISLSTSSPTRWPSVSLTTLKRSRSMKSTPTREPPRRAWSRVWRRLSTNTGRLARAGELVVGGLVVQLPLGAATLGDVRERAHHAVRQQVVVAQRPRVQREPPLLAVRELDADQHVRERLAGAQRADRRVLVVGDEEAVGVAGAQLLAEHRVEALADHDAAAEDALRGAVGGGDDALVVADDDALVERRDHGGVALLDRPARGFGAAPLGDVGAHHHAAGDLRDRPGRSSRVRRRCAPRAASRRTGGGRVSRCLAGSSPSRGSAPTTSANFGADHGVARPAVHLLGGRVPAVDAPCVVESDDRVGDVLDELGLVPQGSLRLLAQREVAQDDLVGGSPVPLRANAERLDDHDRDPSRRTSVASAGLVAASSSFSDAMRSRVSSSESGWMNWVIDSTEVVVEVGDADEVGRGLVHPADQPVLVHDDAVGAQLEEEAVAVGLLLERLLRAHGLAVTSATRPTHPLMDPPDVRTPGGRGRAATRSLPVLSRITRSSS